MNKTPCKGCERRYIGCHDKCNDYQASKAQYKQGGYDEAQAYLVDKHWRMKRDYGGRD